MKLSRPPHRTAAPVGRRRRALCARPVTALGEHDRRAGHDPQSVSQCRSGPACTRAASRRAAPAARRLRHRRRHASGARVRAAGRAAAEQLTLSRHLRTGLGARTLRSSRPAALACLDARRHRCADCRRTGRHRRRQHRRRRRCCRYRDLCARARQRRGVGRRSLGRTRRKDRRVSARMAAGGCRFAKFFSCAAAAAISVSRTAYRGCSRSQRQGRSAACSVRRRQCGCRMRSTRSGRSHCTTAIGSSSRTRSARRIRRGSRGATAATDSRRHSAPWPRSIRAIANASSVSAIRPPSSSIRRPACSTTRRCVTATRAPR